MLTAMEQLHGVAAAASTIVDRDGHSTYGGQH